MKKSPPLTTLVPGVLPFDELIRNLNRWDAEERTVKIFGQFYEGRELKLFPMVWINKAFEVADKLRETYGEWRPGKAIGVDPAEGGDSSSWTVGDTKGLIFMDSLKTPDTSIIPKYTIELMREFQVPAERVVFDRGGGGKEHADYLRSIGYNVQTVGFGESVTPPKKRGLTPLEIKKLEEEERYAYVNRRAEMYGQFSEGLNPFNGEVYGIPREMRELVRQLFVFPKVRDKEGRLWLPPKNKPPGVENSNVVTLTELLGCSPDEADSAVLCYRGVFKTPRLVTAGPVGVA